MSEFNYLMCIDWPARSHNGKWCFRNERTGDVMDFDTIDAARSYASERSLQVCL